MKNKLRLIAPLWSMALLLAISLFAGTANFTTDAHAQALTAAPMASPANDATSTVQSQKAAEDFYHNTMQTVKDNFLWQDRLGDWDLLMHKYDGKLATMTDAHKALNASLGTLKDGYTYFKDEQLTKNGQNNAAAKNVVSWHLIPNTDIGYIKIRTFGSTEVAAEVAAALKSMPTAKAYVLDLRDNGGGFIWQSLTVFSMFTDNAKYATIKGMKGGAVYTEELAVTATSLLDTENGKTTTHPRTYPNLAGGKPLIILVNGDSASASEMLAGATMDNNLGTTLGTHSYGKGIGQLTYNLDHNTAVQVTFAYLYWPKGRNIHKVGFDPDHVVKPGPVGDVQLDAAVADLQKRLAP